MAKKEPKAELAVSPTALPAYMQGADAHQGFEDLRGQDIEFPRLKLIQKMSAEVDSGVRPGSMLDHITGDLIADPEESLGILLVLHFPSWIEWRHQDDGGGIIEKSMDPKSVLAARATRGERNSRDKQAVTEYHNFIVVVPDLENGMERPMLLSFAKTNFKHGKRLVNLARLRKAPIYAGRYKVSTVLKTNGDYKWYETVPANDGWATEEQFPLLQAMHEELAPLMRAGRFNVAAGLDDDESTRETTNDVDDADIEY